MFTAATLPWKLRPVFLSSTFLDMQAERDHLRRHVFPRLEEALRARRHHLDWIDLRQGIEPGEGVAPSTAEQRELLVLKVCLAEVKRSRPFLIVLLGDRYGWVPPPERIASAAREAGFAGDIAGHSVTALEIEYGIFKDSADQPHHCFFYIREPLPYESMPPALRGRFCERYDAAPDAPAKWAELEKLKQRLATDPELKPRVRRYRADWDPNKSKTGDVSGLEEWGNMVFDDIWRELDAETRAFAAAPAPTWEDTERAALAEFIEHRTRDFTGRDDSMASLLALAKSSTAEGALWGACVTGPPGSGKSALFAKLASDLSVSAGTLLLANSAGGTLRGSNVDAMLRRWIEELASFLNAKNPLPENASSDDVDQAFASLLGQAALQTRIVVLLDALDQFETTPRARHLTWRPKLWPPNARLLATGLPGPQAVALSQWAGVEENELPPLDVTHARAIARTVWHRYHVPWTEPVWQALAEKKLPDGAAAVGNPLWTTLACEQLALLDADDFARASLEFRAAGADTQARLAVLRHALATDLPPDVPGLYGRLLVFAEKIHGTAPARAFAVAIALSRHGWRESDLAALVPRLARRLFPDTPSIDITPLELAGLRRTFRAHLVRRGAEGQWDFAHAQMRLAVERHAIDCEPARRALHAAVADHLETLSCDDDLQRHERIRQLIGERNTLRAARYYAKLEWLSPNEISESTSALAEWIAIGERPPSELESERKTNSHLQWVASWLHEPELTPEEFKRLWAGFHFVLSEGMKSRVSLSTLIELEAACAVANKFVTMFCPGDEASKISGHLSSRELGQNMLAMGDTSHAADVLNEGLNFAKEQTSLTPNNSFLTEQLAASHESIGDLSIIRGDVSGATEAYRASLALSEQLAKADPNDLALQHRLSNRYKKVGNVLRLEGKFAASAEVYRASLMIAERLANVDLDNDTLKMALADGHRKIGDVLLELGELVAAAGEYSDAFVITERLAVADPDDRSKQRALVVSYRKIGDLLLAQANPALAFHNYHVSLPIAEKLAAADPTNIGAQIDLMILQNKIGDVLFAQGRLAGAGKAFRVGLAIAERLAATDPFNVVRQHDLWMSYGKIATVAEQQGKGDSKVWWQKALAQLTGMKQRGLSLSPQDEGALELLRQKISDATVVASDPPATRDQTRDELRASADHSFSRGHWEAAETGFEKLLMRGEALTELAPKLVTCLIRAHEILPPSNAARIEALAAKVESSGSAALAAELRRKLVEKQASSLPPAPKKPWWKWW